MSFNLTPGVLWGYAVSAAVSTLKLCLVIVPLVAMWEVLKGIPQLTRQGKRLAPVAARLHLSPRSVFPLAAGMFLGLIYGAGILISEARERKLSGREVLILALFLASCHAVIEDTLLFVVLGGNGWWILATRLVVAVVATTLVGNLTRPRAES